MIKGILYFIVIIIANTIGAISGMGGGVIIKPVFDFVAVDSVMTISFYSSVAVFVMSIVSTVRQIQSGQKISPAIIIYLAFGSLIGGYLGNMLFDILISVAGDRLAHLVQLNVTIVVLIFSLLASRNFFREHCLTLWAWYFLCGMILGCLSSFLGIGGGPINVSLFMILFSIPIKTATIYSIATIFFSQLSKIISLILLSHFNQFDKNILIFIIVAAICGGLLGSKLSRILSESKVALIFQLVVMGVLLINIYNIYVLI